MNLLKKWKAWRNLDLFDDISKWEDDDLIKWLPFFLHEIFKGNGERYQNESLQSILAGLQYHINEENQKKRKPKINFFTDFKFKEITESLDSAMQTSFQECPSKKKAGVVSFDEEKKLWDADQLGSETPTQIINTLFY